MLKPFQNLRSCPILSFFKVAAVILKVTLLLKNLFGEMLSHILSSQLFFPSKQQKHCKCFHTSYIKKLREIQLYLIHKYYVRSLSNLFRPVKMCGQLDSNQPIEVVENEIQYAINKVRYGKRSLWRIWVLTILKKKCENDVTDNP